MTGSREKQPNPRLEFIALLPYTIAPDRTAKIHGNHNSCQVLILSSGNYKFEIYPEYQPGK